MNFKRRLVILLVILFSSLFLIPFWGSSGTPPVIHPQPQVAPTPDDILLVLVDQRKPTRNELLNEALALIRNLPQLPFISNDQDVFSLNSSCAVSPSLLDVKFVNRYWQVANTSLGSLYLYGVYYDNRRLSKTALNGPVVRILGMMDRYLEPKQADDLYCQLRFEHENKPVISKIVDRKYAWPREYGDGEYHPYVFTCIIPQSYQGQVPKSVSVANTPCENTRNILGVQNERKVPEKKGTFAICGKGYDYQEDLSIHLVEWIELNRILGAEKIFLYDYGVHPNMSKVLNYYKSMGFLDVIPTSLPGNLPDVPQLIHLYNKDMGKMTNRWMQELIPINDCLYKNLHSYEYIAVIDPDEVIMPLESTRTWKELMKDVKKSEPRKFQESSCFCFRNVYFFDTFMNNRSWFPDIPWYNYHLQHVYRANRHSDVGTATKCFHKVDHVITLRHHYPNDCFGGCKVMDVKDTKAQLQHYRRACFLGVNNCNETLGKNPVMDTTIWKYKDELIDRTEKVLKMLGFLAKRKKS